MNKQFREIVFFVLSGSSAVLVDYLVYLSLINYVDERLAKGVSFIVGSVFAFILNKYLTFKSKGNSIIQLGKFAVLYFTSFFVNVYINQVSLEIFNNVNISFLLATSASTILNFIGQKLWVFRKGT